MTCDLNGIAFTLGLLMAIKRTQLLIAHIEKGQIPFSLTSLGGFLKKKKTEKILPLQFLMQHLIAVYAKKAYALLYNLRITPSLFYAN